MKAKIVNKNIVLLTFSEQKEIVLSFFRIQEYYESKNPKLKGKAFSVFEFLDQEMNENGEISYFSFWNGFNFPGYVLMNWISAMEFSEKTPYEQKLIEEVVKSVKTDEPFYVIGVMEDDKNTLKHEMCHALYYLNSDFHDEMKSILTEFHIKEPKEFEDLQNTLFNEFKYDYAVLYDEAIAWLTTSTKKELVCDLKCDMITCEPYIKRFKKVLRKYNTFKI